MFLPWCGYLRKLRNCCPWRGIRKTPGQGSEQPELPWGPKYILSAPGALAVRVWGQVRGHGAQGSLFPLVTLGRVSRKLCWSLSQYWAPASGDAFRLVFLALALRSLTMHSVHPDLWIGFLTWPKTCLVMMDLSLNLWTVAYPGSCLQTWSWCRLDLLWPWTCLITTNLSDDLDSQLNPAISLYLPLSLCSEAFPCWLSLFFCLPCHTPGSQFFYSFRELPALTAPSNLLWAGSLGRGAQRSLPTQISLWTYNSTLAKLKGKKINFSGQAGKHSWEGIVLMLRCMVH